MTVDVVAGINAVAAIQRRRFGDVPAERVAHGSCKRQTVVKKHITQFKPNQRHRLVTHQALVIGEIMAEPHIKDERPRAIEHPRGVELQFATPTAIVMLPKIGNLRFSISIEHLATHIHIPPVEDGTVVGCIKAHLVVVDAIHGDRELRAIGIESRDIANGIAVVGIVEHRIDSLEAVTEFGVVGDAWLQVGVPRHIVAGGGIVAERIEVAKVGARDAHRVGQRKTPHPLIVPTQV